MAVTVTRTSTLFGDSDGDGVVDPGETMLVHILIQNTNLSDILNLKVYDTQSGLTVNAGTVKITPIALDDFNGAPLTIVGNTPYILAASALLGNDVDPDGPEASLVISGFTNQSHVTVTDIGGGNLQIVPETGYQGAASFDYFITDAQGLTSVSSGHVNITINGQIWYVDSNASAAGADGSYLHPFQDFTKLNDDGTGNVGTFGTNDGIKGDDDVDGTGDTIFVYNRGVAYTGGITLEAGQKLYGDAHALTVNGLTIGDSGANGTANSTVNYSTYGVTLSTDNTISGLTLNGTANTAVGIQDGNGSVTTAAGTLNIDTVTLSGAGQAVDIDQGGNLNVAITSLSTTGTAAGLQGVQLAGTASSGTALISGTFTAAGGSIAGESSHGFLIGGAGPSSGGTIAVTYNGTIGSSSTGSAVNIADRLASAGTVVFGGNISQASTTSNTTAGIALSNIAGGIINFTGTKTIAVNSGSQSAIQVSGQSGGTIKFSTGAIDIDLATGTTGGHGIAVTGQTGGSLNLETGATIDLAGTASGRGVSISTSTGGSVNFTGGGVVINTRDGAALYDSNAAGSTHALNISGAGNNLGTTNGGQLVEIVNAATTGITLGTLNAQASVANTAVHINNLDGGSFNTSFITVAGTTGAGSDGIRIEGGASTVFGLGSVTVSATSDDGVEINGAGNGAVTIDTISVQNTAGQGVEINGATSAVTITNGGIGNTNDPTQQGVLITGGNANVTIGATVAKTTAGSVVDVNNHTGGTVAFSNALTSSAGGGGISLATNSGSTINFTGKLDLNTSTANVTGFSATGGGTVSASNTSNVVNSGTASAIVVQNTNIGAADLIFKTVTSTGGSANGIILDTTGSAGGLHILGSGTTQGALGGGVISGKTTGADLSTSQGTGIYLNNTQDVQLNGLVLNGGFNNYGIKGSSVTGFSLTNSTLSGTFGTSNTGPNEETAIRFDNLWTSATYNSATISDSSIGGGYSENIRIMNTSGTLDRLTINNVQFGLISAVGGNDNVHLEVTNTGTAKMTVTNSTFAGTRGDFVEAIANLNSTLDVVVRNNTFNNGQAIIPGGGTAVSVRGGSGGNNSAATTTFDISHNHADQGGANAFDTVGIFVAKGQDLGTLQGSIQSNFLVGQTGKNSDGIFVRSSGGGTTTVLIQNNSITNWGNDGIHLQNNDGSTTMNATVYGNTVGAPGNATPFADFFADNGATASDTSKMNLVLGSAGTVAQKNTFTHSAAAVIDVSLSNFSANTTFNLSRNGSAAGTVAGVVQNDNISPNNGAPTVDTTGGSGTITLVNTMPATPPVVAAMMLAPPPPVVEPSGDVPVGDKGVTTGGTVDVTGEIGIVAPPTVIGEGSPSPLDTPPASPAVDVPAPAAPIVNDDGRISPAELDLLVAAAIDRWAANGADADQIAAMKAVKVEIADMMGLQIGGASAGLIQIDDDAGGYGWFVDATPGDDSEYAGSGTRLKATSGSAAGHVDLLTVLIHELGHQIGLGDDYNAADGVDAMYGFMDVGERRLPAAGDAARASGHAPAAEAFILSPVADVGTLPAGKSVDIQFQATVDSYFNQVISPLTNTATATGDNISDTTSAANVTVIDTMTLGDRVFVDANNNGVFDPGEGKNGVTLTLFADTNNNGVLDIGTDVQLLTTVTAGSGAAVGTYSFANLSAGNYIVRVDASNFSAGGALAGMRSVFGGVDPDGDAGSGFNVDNDDNGVAGPGGSVVAAPITLAYGTETTSDGGAIPKNDINNTLDFGFVVNSAPTANADNVSATEDTPAQYSTELTGNDTDADLDTLTITGVSNFVNGTASVAGGIVTFTPNANFNGIASFDYTISDGNGHTATATATVTVGAVNDPIGTAAPASVTLNEDATNFAVSGLSISDVDSTLAPAGVYEVTLSSTHGTLTLSTIAGLTFTGGSDGTADSTMTFHGTLSSINTALATAKYNPDANYHGVDAQGIVLQATDTFGGTVATGNGSATTSSKNVSVTVNSVNDMPSGTNDNSNTVEGTTYTFESTDFTDGFSDPIDGDAFKAVVITTLPTVGTLKLNGVAIAQGATITLADLTGHAFTYDAPMGSGNSHPSFTFQVQDNGGTLNGGVDLDSTPNTYTFDIAQSNQPPVLDLDGNDSSGSVGTGFASSYTEGGAAAAIADTDITITDSDPGDDIVSAVVTLTNPVTGDQLNVASLPAGITVDPSSTATTVKLVGIAGTSAADFQTAIQAITFSSTSDDPTSHGANTARTVTVVVNDGMANSNTATTTITVVDVNDAPTGASATITAIEDTGRLLAAAEFGGSDVDGSVVGVTISAVTGGKIYYDADGTAGAGAPVLVTLPQTYSLQDFADGKVSFKADSNLNGAGAGSITFTVVDDDGASSASPNVLTVNVTAQNDSPVVPDSPDAHVDESYPAKLNPTLTVSDVDLDARNGGAGDYGGAQFVVQRSGGGNTQDQFILDDGAGFTVTGGYLSGGLLQSNGLTFGNWYWDSTTGVVTVYFTSAQTPATTALVNAVVQSIQYNIISDAPPASVDLVYTLNDGSPGGNQGPGAPATDSGTIKVIITPTNDGPWLDLLNPGASTDVVVNYTENDPATILAPTATVADPDLQDFGTGKLTVNLASTGVSAEDRLSIAAQGMAAGQVGVTGSNVYYGGVLIGTFTGGTNGSTPLVVTFNTNAYQDAVIAVVRRIAYTNVSDAPATTDRVVYLDLTDGHGGQSNLTTATVHVAAVDDKATAVDDQISTAENVVATGNVFDPHPTTPDSDIDGPALTVSAVLGGTVGTQFALASGALLTVNSDGTYSYDPNGQFNSLVAASSGAVNTTATDQFTYTLLNGDSATVYVTINGAASAGDVFTGDGTDNVITSGGGNDIFDVSQGGNDTVTGNGGDDYFYFGGAFTTADTVNGGAGTDTVALLGNYNLTLGANSLTGIEKLNLLSGIAAGGSTHVTYAITLVDENIPAGGKLTVYGGGLLSDETLYFNGYAETDGSVSVYGGAGNDTFAGGSANDAFVGGAGNDVMYGLGGNDWLEGGLGADQMRGGLGNDLFVYQSAAESTATSMDHIFDFEETSDHIDLSRIDANTNAAGDQDFNFIGSNAFSNTAGELRAYQSGGSWFVEGDVNGDGTADLVIQVDTFHGHIMAASDFIL